MPVLFAIFLFLICLASMELYFISFVAARLGILGTLILVLGTGVLGAVVARKNAKLAIANLMKGDFRSGPPERQMFDAVVFFIAAALLIIPGILTDVAGLILLFPGTRSALYRNFTDGKVTIRTSTEGDFSGSRQGSGVRDSSNNNTLGYDDVIDVSAEDVSGDD